MNQPTGEMVALFQQRTARHIELVQLNLLSMTGLYGLNQLELESRAFLHDKSKYDALEMPGYTWLTWQYHCKSKNTEFTPTEEIRKLINQSMELHRSRNRHHPEAHSNTDAMTTLDTVEMVCDWHAISQENGTGRGATAKWAHANRGKWNFSSQQIKLIEEVINQLEDQNA